MSRAFLVVRGGAAIAIVTIMSACSSAMQRPTPAAAPAEAQTSSADRMTVRTGEQQVAVDSPALAGRSVERLIQQSGGYLERTSGSTDGNVLIEGRVPAVALDALMDSVATLGKERRRRTTGVDVTDQYSDLQARLNSDIALRDRFRQLVDRAATLDEILNLEQQIARLQADIDGLQSRIDRLKMQTELAALSVSLDRKHVLGPLAIAGRGVAGLFAKLFVVR